MTNIEAREELKKIREAIETAETLFLMCNKLSSENAEVKQELLRQVEDVKKELRDSETGLEDFLNSNI